MTMKEEQRQVLHSLTSKYPELDECSDSIKHAFELIKSAYEQGGKALLCGNGGSAADCEHIVGELMKGFMSKRTLPESRREQFAQHFPDDAAYLTANLQGALPAVSLVSHSALMTAFANDVAADMVFAQQVYGYGKPGDVLIGLSTSGSSANVVRAMQVAKVLGLRTIGLTGRSGGKLNELCDATVRVPWEDTPAVQERHLPIYHALCIMIEQQFFAEADAGK
jgi:phosphoheptose isomerase